MTQTRFSRRLPQRLITVSAICASLAACAAGPNYVPPGVTLPASYQHAASAAGLADAPSLDTWWEGFHDPQLTRIVQRVQAQNLDLEIGRAHV